MTIGIYCIKNKINSKRYIGKSKNIERRFSFHRNKLCSDVRDKKQTNRFLFNSVKKYGIENFEFLILEEFYSIDEDLLKDRELFWMDFYNTCNRDFGYNLRRDSSTNTIMHEDTRKLMSEQNTGQSNPNYGNKWTNEQKERMSEIKKKQIQSGMYDWMQSDEWKQKLSENSKSLWANKDKKTKMAKKVADAKSVLRFYQYCKYTNELIKVWESMAEIKLHHPDYHDKSIYSVCNGHKKSYKGYIWKSEEKLV